MNSLALQSRTDRSPLHAEIAALRDRNGYLEEENRQLREKLKVDVCWPAEWGLTKRQSSVLGVLFRHAPNLVSKDALLDCLYGDRADDPPHERIIDVFVCKLRAKLAAADVVIATVWGQGYRLDAEMARMLRAQLVASDKHRA